MKKIIILIIVMVLLTINVSAVTFVNHTTNQTSVKYPNSIQLNITLVPSAFANESFDLANASEVGYVAALATNGTHIASKDGVDYKYFKIQTINGTVNNSCTMYKIVSQTTGGMTWFEGLWYFGFALNKNITRWNDECVETKPTLNVTSVTNCSQPAGISNNGTNLMLLNKSGYICFLNASGNERSEDGGIQLDVTDTVWSKFAYRNGTFYLSSNSRDTVYLFDKLGNKINEFYVGGDGSINVLGLDAWDDFVVLTDFSDSKVFIYNLSTTSETTLSTNGTGTWRNITGGEFGSPCIPQSITSSKKICNFTWTNNNLFDYTTIGWKVYGNDTDGTTKESSIGTFTIQSNVDTNITYTTPETETAESTFTLFINGSNTTLSGTTFFANLVYNNTLYTPIKVVSGKTTTFTKELELPLVDDDDNITEERYFYWNYSLSEFESYNTSNYIQTINKISIRACGNLTNTTTLNITFYDEITDDNITTNFDGTFKLRVNLTGSYRNQSFNRTGNYSYEFCIYPNTTTLIADATFLYDATGYEIRTQYYCQKSLTSTTFQDSFYHLSTANATAVTLTLTDDSDDPIRGYYIDLMRWYPGTNSYKTVEVDKTDADGQARQSVELYDVFYKWRFRQCNTIHRETEKNLVTKTTLTYQMTLGTDYLDDWDSLESIDFGFAWDNATDTFTFSWRDTGGEAEYYCLKVVKFTGLGNTVITDTCSTEKSGALEYTLTDLQGRHIATAYTKQSGSEAYEFLLDTIEVFQNRPWADYFGATGLIMTIIWLMSLAPIGLVVMQSPAGIPIFILLGLGAFGLAGIVALKITVFVSLALLVGIMIWRMKR